MGGRSGVEERPWPHQSYKRISVGGLLGRLRMFLGQGQQVDTGRGAAVHENCVADGLFLFLWGGGIGGPGFGDVGEEVVGCLA